MKLLEGKVAIITGASRGIGSGIAKVFAQHGANVAFTYSSSVESAQSLENELSAMGIKAKGYKSNAADFNEAQKLVDDVMSEFGNVDILINNAGITKDNLLMRMSEEDFVQLQINQITSPWMQYFIKYDPAPTLEKVKCPVLAINGEKDLQVPPKENLEAIKKALEKGGNKKATTKELPKLNHLFQECETGSPNVYAVIEQTFSPIALTEILNWISKQVE